jgi:hypothetical protein
LYTVLSEYFTVVNPFCHAGTWEYSKAWVGQPEAEANVYRAIKDWTTNNPLVPVPVVTRGAQTLSPRVPFAARACLLPGCSLLHPALTQRLPLCLFDLIGRRLVGTRMLSGNGSEQLPAGYHVLQLRQ